MGTQYSGSLEESRAAPGIAYTLRVGVEPFESPSEAALAKITNIEAKQSKAERDVFAQARVAHAVELSGASQQRPKAAKEMQSLTRAVLLELAVRVGCYPAARALHCASSPQCHTGAASAGSWRC